MTNHAIGILGGTFDPIHHGHLRTAHEVLYYFNLTEVRFIPCKQPVHKSNVVANPEQRLAMLRLAVQSHSKFVVDERELRRTSASYTVETLQSLRQETPNASLCLIMGTDTYLDVPTWHRWQEILTIANIIVVHRPGNSLPESGLMINLLRQHSLEKGGALTSYLFGRITLQTITALEITATDIRDKIKQRLYPDYLLPQPVNQYIKENKIYQS